MQKMIDKAVLLGLCLTALMFADIGWISIVTMLCAIAVSSLCSYFEGKLPSFLCVLYVAVCLPVPVFVVFLPLILYDCAGLSKLPLRFCWIAALPMAFIVGTPQIAIAIILLSAVAFLLQYRTASQYKTRDEYFALMDSSKEQTDKLERKNRDRMEKQDYEVQLATLAERNRIAREIHDNVGHLLTRSLLQIGALHVTRANDDRLVIELDMIKDTLSDAMDSIRSSVHGLHEESVDLRSRLQSMADGFEFCPVKLRYDADDLPVEVRYCFSSIVREALSNIARHSDATEAVITITEHPAFCQLLISDNGSKKTDAGPLGIGLQNMADRVDALGGVFRTEYNKGFRIFISIPDRSTK